MVYKDGINFYTYGDMALFERETAMEVFESMGEDKNPEFLKMLKKE